MGENHMQIKMTSQVFAQIKNSIGTLPSETGGMLGTTDGETIDHFYFDNAAKTSGVIYVPNIQNISKVLNVDWENSKAAFSGFIHSHPYGMTYPSGPDEEYAIRIMKKFKIHYFYMPIVQSSHAGRFSIHSYMMVYQDGKYHLETSELIVDGKPYDPNQMENPFSRIENFIDIPLMAKSTIIGIGCGGARDYYLDMARCGVGTFILMDGDDVSVSNIASQGVFHSEIGLSKVDATKHRILDINPNAKVYAVAKFLKNEFTDEDFAALLKYAPNRELIVLAGFTDDFYAQARTARLALKFSLKYIAALHYDFGIASEILYWYPNVSLACPRCLLEKRYQDNLVGGYIKDVTSNSAPVFISRRLDSTCEKITLGMLIHQTSPDSPYASFITKHPEANYLIQRHQENAATKLGLDVFFADSEYRFNDDTIWLPLNVLSSNDPDFVCPDCLNQIDAEPIAKNIVDSRTIVSKIEKTTIK
jgi:proteasome lid subunit RPN8/RPN11